MDIVGLNSPDHVAHQRLATHVDTTNGANVAESVDDARLPFGTSTTKESDHTDHTLKLDALEALRERAAATNLNNVVHASTIGSQLASSLAPVRVVLVVDDMVGSELLELLSLLGR